MAKISLKIIKVYQKLLSPFLVKNCRFHPSCSIYSYQAIEKYGFYKGVAKSVLRILKCQPLCRGGIDEV